MGVHLCCRLLLVVLQLEVQGLAAQSFVQRVACCPHKLDVHGSPHLLLLEVQDLAAAGWAQVLHVNGVCTDGQVCVCARVVSCLL